MTKPRRLASELPSSRKHRIEHWLRKAPGEGVLLAGVITAKHPPFAHLSFRCMAESRPWPGNLVSKGFKCPQGPVPGKPAQGDDRAAVPQQRQLALEIWQASVSLVRARTVCGRRAAHHGSHVDAVQLKSVIPVRAGGLVREASPMQGRVEPVAGAIAGKYATRAIPAVGSRRKADDSHPCVWVAKAA